MQIIQAMDCDLPQVAELAWLLWPNHSREELLTELCELLLAGRTACFLALAEGQAVAFAQCSLRSDYVEGTDESPVGYLEGIYVQPEWRGQDVARALLQACEAWSRERGCRQLASDCELSNQTSLAFHLHAGFREANRIICFVKDIDRG